MKSQLKLSRRDFLHIAVVGAAGAAFASCTTPTAPPPQIIEKTVEVKVKETVEVPIEKVVEQTVVVQPTPIPATLVPEPERTKVVTMGVSEGEFSKDELDAFIKQAKYVSEVERLEGDSARLKASFAAGTPPDIWRGSGADVPTVVTYGWALDLTDFFNTSKVLQPADLMSAVDYFKYKGGWYGMHKDFSPDMSIQLNAAAFEDAGLPVPEDKKIYTYQEAADWARKLTKKEGDRTVRIGWGDNDYWDGILQTVLMEDDQNLFNNDFTKATIKDNPLVVEVLTYYAGLAKENVIWNPLNPSPSWAGDDYTVGRAGVIRYGYWMHGVVAGADPTTLAAPLEKFLMRPGLSWKGKKIVNPPLGGAGWFMARMTKVPHQSWELFEYYMGGEPAKARAKGGWGLPALKSLLPLLPQNSALDKQWYDSTVWQLDNTVQTPRPLNPFVSTGVINSAWVTNLELYLRGKASIEEAIVNVDTEVNRIITERISTLS